MKSLFCRRNLTGQSIVVESNQDQQIDWRNAGYQPMSETEPDDIFIVGYPKSGNTWLQNLIAGVLFGIDTRLLTDRMTQLLVPNVHGFQYYKRVAERLFFKSHFLPQPHYRRVIYLVRDGRDAMVSYYHMLQAESSSALTMKDVIVDGEGLFPCRWHEHAAAWSENPHAAEILVIRYEDLHRDAFGQLEKICRFADLQRSAEILRRSIDGNTFDSMQRKEEEFGWDNQNWNSKHKFIRRGDIGSFKSEMPAEILEHFQQLSEAELLKFGYTIDG